MQLGVLRAYVRGRRMLSRPGIMARSTSIVLDAHLYPRIEVLRRDVDRLLGIDVDVLVLGCVVRRSGRYLQYVLVVAGHCGRDSLSCCRMVWCGKSYGYQKRDNGIIASAKNC
jgi:hypothetical protein